MKLYPAAITWIPWLDIFRSIIPRSQSFELKCAALAGKDNAVYTKSLMRAVRLCMELVAQGRSQRKVIMPRYICPSFTHGVLAAGFEPVFVDLDPNSFEMGVGQIETAIEGSVAAVIVPNLFGYSSDLEAIRSLCDRYGVLMIEGADYSFGGSYLGRAFGSFGHLSILNFQEGKAIPIGGGMVLFGREFSIPSRVGRLSSVVPFFRTLAFKIFSMPLFYFLLRKSLQALRISHKMLSMEDTIRRTNDEFSFSISDGEGYKKISHFQNSLGLYLLDLLEHQRNCREQNFEAIRDLLSGVPGISVPGHNSNITRKQVIRTPIYVRQESRERIISYLNEYGFEASPMYSEHGLKVDESRFVGAAYINRSVLTLPCHVLMTKSDVNKMVERLKEIV